MKTILRRKRANRKRRLERRRDKTDLRGCSKPRRTASNLHSEIADRCRAFTVGGIGARHTLAQQLGLVDAIDQRLHLLKIHRPYQESDPVLALAYLPLCGGTCLEDLERLRHDAGILDAVGARRLPDPTTAGACCRRFSRADIYTLLDLVADLRIRVWARPPAACFTQALIDRDGFLVESTGPGKQGRDSAYDGTWGYHALVLSVANTGDVLSVVNRSANRPSPEGAAAAMDRVLPVCFRGGFHRVWLRGDTKFPQTAHLDRWDDDPRVQFRVGFEAVAAVAAIAADWPAGAWKPLQRPARYAVQTQPRQRPDNVKEAVVVARAYENQRLPSEDVAECNYQPTACKQP